jgi:NADH dehydrogenase FAD-containing subunit
MDADSVISSETVRSRVVIVGGGFGGIECAKALASAPCTVTLIDRQNHHCFQPLLYQVATAALSPADVAWPIRSILSPQTNAHVVMAEVVGIDRQRRQVLTSCHNKYAYEYLVLATGPLIRTSATTIGLMLLPASNASRTRSISDATFCWLSNAPRSNQICRSALG